MSENKPVINVDDEDFGLMLISAIRYSLGRMTYIVMSTVNYTIPLVPYLSFNTLRVIENDIQQHADFYDLGMECDRHDWFRLLEAVRKEMLERMVENAGN